MLARLYTGIIIETFFISTTNIQQKSVTPVIYNSCFAVVVEGDAESRAMGERFALVAREWEVS